MTSTEITDRHNRDGLEAWIERQPPFDCILGQCRSPGCPGGIQLGGGSHGRGAASYRWVIRGEGLAVQFLWKADEHLPESIEACNAINPNWRNSFPLAADLGYHAATPMYEDQWRMDECDILGIPCYYDGSGLNAEPVLELLQTEGREATWERLEQYWHETFAELMATLP